MKNHFLTYDDNLPTMKVAWALLPDALTEGQEKSAPFYGDRPEELRNYF